MSTVDKFIEDYKNGNWKDVAKEASRYMLLQTGYVYLAHLENTPYYKIGVSKFPAQRIKNFGLLLPENVVLVHKIYTTAMRMSEGDLHRKYHSKRVNGEWFTLNLKEVDEICQINCIFHPEMKRLLNIRRHDFWTASEFEQMYRHE